ncbi:adenylate cyclase-like protein [Leptomonas pyrrhocoris]|uniref:Adenylate cyclase-like protein n=1 Tax=Leptomonas pyrrhocoris TaxID=157538 RepID=A0A0N0DQW3_LEPPY|nr:adenylate cyclase-like protein [Leptomonas pyrrhocoris]KPA73611.1 adenylate cyclase-like protein [Leptomonas pyrrhocoris]|eukprot:XP_015652050.1 adenylate cyclase-like protein [Leptomonas pyrrhocoris]
MNSARGPTATAGGASTARKATHHLPPINMTHFENLVAASVIPPQQRQQQQPSSSRFAPPPSLLSSPLLLQRSPPLSSILPASTLDAKTARKRSSKAATRTKTSGRDSLVNAPLPVGDHHATAAAKGRHPPSPVLAKIQNIHTTTTTAAAATATTKQQPMMSSPSPSLSLYGPSPPTSARSASLWRPWGIHSPGRGNGGGSSNNSSKELAHVFSLPNYHQQHQPNNGNNSGSGGGASETVARRAKSQSSYKRAGAAMQQQLRAFMAGQKRSAKPSSSNSATDAPTSNERNVEPYVGLTSEEKQELFVLLHDLSKFLAPRSEEAAARRMTPLSPAPTEEAATEAPPPSLEAHSKATAGNKDCNDVGVNGTPTEATSAAQTATTLAAAAVPTTTTTVTEASTNHAHMHAADHHDGGADEHDHDDNDDHHHQRRALRKRSVEGRYKEALKTVEHAVGDCQMALKRVEEYCASLYTLVETWMDLHEQRFDEFARTVLQRMLDDNPAYRVLFYDVDLSTQSLIIMDMIGRAVVAFTRPADLMDIMGEMGARHNLYGLRESHYVAMRNAFLKVYAEFVGPATYKESVAVWKMFWKTTIELAVSGASSERGEIYAQRRLCVWSERIKAVFRHLIPLQCRGGFHRLLKTAYGEAVAKYPELEVFQQFEDLRTAHRAMEALIRIVKSVADGGAPAAITYSDQLSIQSLFTEYGAEFNADVMKKLEEPFLDACESYMASTGMWNVVVRAVLQELWSVYITGYWTAQPASGEHERHGGSAPDGKTPFCLMFTDIEASTRLWDSDPKVMGAAVRLHHKLVRGLIEDFGGYEVKTVGDSFIIAANTVTQALHIALGIQLELMAEPSAPDFRMVDSPQGAGDPACWREDALRVRVGVHYCADASAVYDSVHRRFDYYGPSVNCAARVEAAACGGQVLLSHEAYAQLQTEEDFDQVPVNSLFAEHLGQLVRAQEARGVAVTDPQLAYFGAALKREQMKSRKSDFGSSQDSAHTFTTVAALTRVTDIGCRALKGIAEPVHLYSVLPVGLEGRVFAAAEEASLRTLSSGEDLLGSSGLKEYGLTPPSADDALVNCSASNSASSLAPPPASRRDTMVKFLPTTGVFGSGNA